MSAEFISAPQGALSEETIQSLAKLLREGELVALPTETVYGIGARQDLPEALERLRDLKGRGENHPFTIHLPSRDAIESYPVAISPFAQRLIDRYWPGPMTLVLPLRKGGALGFRVPAKEITREILRLVEAPVVMSSANPTGKKPAVNASEVRDLFPTGLRAILDAGPCPLGEASTVLRLSEKGPEMLREGIITLEDIRRAMGKSVLFVCTGNTCRSPLAEAMLRKYLSEKYSIPAKKLADFGYRIGSAGIVASEGAFASTQTQEAGKEAGLDISGHRSRHLTPEMLAAADLVLVMSRSHLLLVQDMLSEGKERCRLLHAEDKDIPDPFGGSLEDYRECREQMRRSIEKILPEI